VDSNEIEMPELQPPMGLRGEIPILCKLPDMPLQGEHQEGKNMKTTREELERMYWQEKRSTTEIAHSLNLNRVTIWRKMIKFGIPRRSRSLALKIVERKFPTHLFVEPNINPSNDLSYVLGVIKGDGCAYVKRGHRCGIVKLNQIRAEFAQSFECALKQIGFNPNTFVVKPRKTTYTDCPKPMFVTIGYSFPFVQWYKQLSFEDIEKLLGDNPEFIEAFIRGFFESEGTNCIKPRKESNAIKWQIDIAGRNKELYDLVERLLIRLGFNFNRYCYNQGGKPLHILKSSNQRQNYHFIKTIAPCIKDRTIEPTSRVEIEWTREKVIEKLKSFVDKEGFSPSSREIPDTLRGAIDRHFGGMNKAKKVAGIKIYPVGYHLDAKTGQNSWQTRRGNPVSTDGGVR
jgi:intein-encoded DNA endonuclease-like protein